MSWGINLKLPTLLAATVFVYIWSITNPFIWDDQQFIYDNIFITSFDIYNMLTQSITTGAGVQSTYYRPLLAVSFALDYQFWGFNTIGFHLTNLFFHTAAGGVLWHVLKNWQIKQWQRFFIVGAFLLHPVQTESVIYINSRGDSLYAFWGLLSLYFWQAYTLYQTKKIEWLNLRIEILPRISLLISFFASIVALLSKEIAIASLGLPILWSLYCWLTHSREKKYLLQLFWWLVCCGVIIGSYVVLRTTLLPTPLQLDQSALQVVEPLQHRVFTFIATLLTYSRFLIFPFPLHMERSVESTQSLLSVPFLASLSLLGLIIFIGVKELGIKKSVFILVGLGWFLGMLVPVSGIVPINGQLYEHWLYMPQIGWWLMLFGLWEYFEWPKLPSELLLGILLVWGVLSMRQNYIWGDPVRFYSHTLQYAKSARLYNNLGMALAEKGNTQASLQAYQSALELGKYPQTWHNIGNLLAKQGEIDPALQAYYEAIKLDPAFAPSYQAAIGIHTRIGQEASASALIRQFEGQQPQE